ncbi:Celf2 [Bugula neritina]|uniref:Celf2 n=1 Tax=Bugula neritina TaxID=10212 RepID=A0A7J7KMN4_BUGNE|nr:Celf2 [Bugula neritina]
MMTMHSISPAQKVTSPMMSLSQTNTIPSDGLQPLNNNTIKQMDITSVDPSIMGDGPTSSPSPNAISDDSIGKREPDPDAIKMFVGQVPKYMEESELREMFSKYGDIFQLNVLRDKVSGTHRGCCFVTFYTRKSAIMAQDALHGKHTLGTMHHPIQMKPADNEKKNVEDRKLFIGMISKKLSETDIKQLFQPYGAIDDCMILRDTSGTSRGCAFVTYTARDSAITAIRSMHHSVTMEGCSSPMVVKFADTQKDKDVRTKVISTNNNIIGAHYPNGIGIPANMTHQYLTLLQHSLGAPVTIPTSPLGNIDMASFQNYHNIQNLQSMGMLPGQNLIGIQAISGAPLTMTRAVASPPGDPQLAVNSMGGLQAVAAAGQQAVALPGAGVAANAAAAAHIQQQVNVAASVSPQQPSIAAYPAGHALGGGVTAAASVAALQTAQPSLSSNAAIDAALTQAYSGIAQYTASFPHAYAPTALAADTPAGKQTEGPDGANLFIYHLPQEFTDIDLLRAFAPFGNVVSSKVFIDKQTNLSKCFGFVSYDNPMSAQNAIGTMNGFQVGMKRLKVQLKRPKNENKPYCSNYFCFNVFVYVLQSIYVRSRSTYMYVKYLSLADWSLYHPLDVCNLVCNWLICFVSSNRNRYNNQCVRLLLLLVCK